MKQFSIDNSAVELEIISGHLLFIDPLYFDKIAENKYVINLLFEFNLQELVVQIEENFSPWR